MKTAMKKLKFIIWEIANIWFPLLLPNLVVVGALFALIILIVSHIK